MKLDPPREIHDLYWKTMPASDSRFLTHRAFFCRQTVSEACVQGRLWRKGAECLDVGVKSGVGRECLRQLTQHAYEACAAGRMWEELKQVRR